MIDEINNLIKNLTRYGYRSETKPKEATVLFWSNGNRKWFIDRRWSEDSRDTEKEINLDANELVVPYPVEKVEKITEQLIELPLYSNSTEARFPNFFK